MKNSKLILIIVLIVCIICTGCDNNKSNDKEKERVLRELQNALKEHEVTCYKSDFLHDSENNVEFSSSFATHFINYNDLNDESFNYSVYFTVYLDTYDSAITYANILKNDKNYDGWKIKVEEIIDDKSGKVELSYSDDDYTENVRSYIHSLQDDGYKCETMR